MPLIVQHGWINMNEMCVRDAECKCSLHYMLFELVNIQRYLSHDMNVSEAA